MINIIQNENLIYHIREYDVILIATGIKNAKSNGFQYQIARNFKYVYDRLNETNYDDVKKFGTCLVVPKTEKNPTFVYCFITKNRYRSDITPDTVNYEALESCLTIINDNFKGLKIASTLMGVNKYEGLGDKDKITEMFNNICTDVNIDVYDYEQHDYNYDDSIIFNSIVSDYKNGKIALDEYYRRMSKYAWERRFGMYFDIPKPEYSYIKLKNLLRDKDALARYLMENGYENF